MTTETTASPAANTSEGQAASTAATQATGNTAAAPAGSTTQQATDGQTTSTTATAAGEGTKTEGDTGTQAPAGAPDKYEFKTPEGKAFDANTLSAFSEVAKEINLPQDAAQKVLDKMGLALQARQAEAITAARTEWKASAKSDKEFGGDKFEESMALVNKAREAFTTPELRALLDETGLGDHPEMIRAFLRAGKAISEDRFVGGNTGATPQTTAQRMYPNMNP